LHFYSKSSTSFTVYSSFTLGASVSFIFQLLKSFSYALHMLPLSTNFAFYVAWFCFCSANIANVFVYISDISNSSTLSGKSLKKKLVLENFRTNFLNTTVCIEALWDLFVLPINSTRQPMPEPTPLDLETSALTWDHLHLFTTSILIRSCWSAPLLFLGLRALFVLYIYWFVWRITRTLVNGAWSPTHLQA